jgi:predicted PolB exonuclease-like 3'-5' exonuclease
VVPTLVFDIETVPDAARLRSAWGLACDDDAAVDAALARRRAQTGGTRDFLPRHLHRAIVISMLFRDSEGLRVRSLCDGPDDAGELVQGFFRTPAKDTPTRVSWNGSGFDMRVLHYHGFHRIHAPRCREQGEGDREFRFDDDPNRDHSRHAALMDLPALHDGRANAPLDQRARLCGFPGKLGTNGSQVWPAWRAGRQDEIHGCCQTDDADTWLLHCRLQPMRGALEADACDAEIALTRAALSALPGSHWREFVAAWPA